MGLLSHHSIPYMNNDGNIANIARKNRKRIESCWGRQPGTLAEHPFVPMHVHKESKRRQHTTFNEAKKAKPEVHYDPQNFQLALET